MSKGDGLHLMFTLIYDGDCGICEWSKQWVERHDRAGRIRCVPGQVADLGAISPGLSRQNTIERAYFVMPDRTAYGGTQAVFMTLRHLPGAWRWVGVVGALRPISAMLTPLYNRVAANRHRISAWLGMKACAVPTRNEPENHPVQDGGFPENYSLVSSSSGL